MFYYRVQHDLICHRQVKCHYPKPILLYVGGMTWPSRWSPGVMPIQLFRLGNFYMIGVPGEFTTMSGRRLRVCHS